MTDAALLLVYAVVVGAMGLFLDRRLFAPMAIFASASWVTLAYVDLATLVLGLSSLAAMLSIAYIWSCDGRLSQQLERVSA